MKFIIDTQCWLWWHHSPDRLNASAKRLIADKENLIFFSSASAWEISIKHALGKLALPASPKEFLPERLAEDNFQVLPIELSHSLEVSVLPHHHRDPFDRMLIAQARMENVPILTADPHLGAYPVQVIPAAA